MTKVATALLVVAVLAAGSIAAADPGLAPQADGVFCADKPDSVDSRIATAVNAKGIGPVTTGPVAILDTGVSAAAPEIGERLVSPYDAATGADEADDFDGHGTEVAGIAAGAPGLIQGVSPNSPIMPVRVYNRLGNSSAQWLTAGINWAATHGAAVINVSSSIPEADVSAGDLLALTRAINDAVNKNILVVAAVGNEGNGQRDSPAVLPHVIAVGGSDMTGARAPFSNWGLFVDLVAPAAALIGPMPSNYCSTGYGVGNGTSFAAPSVAAAAALLAARHPEYSPQQRIDVLKTSARDVAPAGREEDTGYGLLDVGAALAARAPVPEASREIDDDAYYVRGPYAAGHPTLLARRRSIRLAGSLSAIKDPVDVYPVRVKKGERLSIDATVGTADSLIALGIWKPTVGDFDISAGNVKQQLVSTGGFSATPALVMRAKKAGTYFMSVEAPDAVDPDDPDTVPPYSQTYQVRVSKSPPPRQKTKTKTKPGRPRK